ncbi:MAG TPA: cell division protein FtsA [Ignavibacteriales bacterium]|nr:cell division protein FtsA [Ignavibacteriales bacterium]
MKREIVAGIDLGTTKICAIIGEIAADNKIDILGFGKADSKGITRGMVNNILQTADSIKEAVEIASNRAGINVTSFNVGVAGDHIKNLKYKNYVTIANKEAGITEDDLIRLDNDIRSIKKEPDKKILHIIPEEYIVDDVYRSIDNPIGMQGSKLEAINNIITAETRYLDNIQRAIEKAGYSINNFVLQPLASANSVLEESEKEVGVMLIDIGGGTTDIAIFENKKLKYSKVYGIGGNMVTNDIRETLNLIQGVAEELKVKYGFATLSAVLKNEEITIPGIGAKKNMVVSVATLTEIIYYRMRELFYFINKDVEALGLKKIIKGGIVLTGGGSLLKGLTELSDEVFGIPARIGIPLNLGEGLSREIETPEFATVTGLIRPIEGLSSHNPIVLTIEKKMSQQAKVQPSPTVLNIEEEKVVEEKVEEKIETKPKEKKESIFTKIKNFFDQL